MPTIDPRVDEYINLSALFAQPVLRHLRNLVHEACPQVEETIITWIPAGIECPSFIFETVQYIQLFTKEGIH